MCTDLAGWVEARLKRRQTCPYPELESNLLYADFMKISGNYSVDAKPYQEGANVSPPLFNRVFADCNQRQS